MLLALLCLTQSCSDDDNNSPQLQNKVQFALGLRSPGWVGAGSDRALAQQLTIVNRKGLHARASARFVRTAECFDAEIKVVRDGQSVAGNSIMGLMMLGAGPGSTILVQATGRQAREALDAITLLVNNGFDEDNEGIAAG